MPGDAHINSPETALFGLLIINRLKIAYVESPPNLSAYVIVLVGTKFLTL